MKNKELKIGDIIYVYFQISDTICSYEYMGQDKFKDLESIEQKILEVRNHFNNFNSYDEALIKRYMYNIEKYTKRINQYEQELKDYKNKISELEEKYGYLKEKYPEEFL